MRLTFIKVGLLVGALVALSLNAPGGIDGQSAGAQEGGFALAIDADIENGDGACDPIDEETVVEVGDTHRVGICILNQPEAPFSFRVLVRYDGSLNEAPELPDILPASDDNPDANSGETTFSSPDLGPGWDCSGLGLFPPTVDLPETDVYDAQLACTVNLRGDPVRTLTESGPLGVITFDATDEGIDRMEFDTDTEIGGFGGTIGTCGLIPDETIPCRGATIFKGVAPTPGPPEDALTPSPGDEATPPATPEDGGFPWAVLGGVLGGVALLLVIAGGAFYLRRRA